MRLVLLGRLLHLNKTIAFAGVVATLALLGCSDGREATPLDIFAAASLQGPLEEVLQDWAGATGTAVRAHYASSSTLARQIELGAAPDVMVSASAEWMNYLSEKGLVDPKTVKVLAGNRLALLGLKSNSSAYSNRSLAEIISQATCISMGDWEHVPAGRYGKEAIAALGLWELHRSKFIPAKDARAALGMLAGGACPLNLGYANLANLVSGVEVLTEISNELHTQIMYLSGHVTEGEHEAVDELSEFLMTPAVASTFRAHGFLPPFNKPEQL